MVKKAEVLRHIPELDGVRGIAVLVVMVAHFYDVAQGARPFSPVDRLMAHGGSGVDLFFVLSGFLITSILVSTRGSLNYFRSFYTRRALRIFPLYILVVAVYFWLVVPYLQHHGKLLWIKPGEQIWYWLFLANWRQAFAINDGAQLAHFWSLAIEEQFYLVWSVLAFVCSPTSLRRLCAIAIVAVVVLRTACAFGGVSYLLLVRASFFRADALAMGALLALSPRFRRFVARWALYVLPVAFVLAMCDPPYDLDLLLYDIGSTALVALAVERSVPALRWSWLRSFGKYSYGLYVLHYLLHGAFAPLAQRFGPRTAVLLSITLGISLSYAAARLSWAILEAPFLKLKRLVPYEFPSASPEPASHSS